MIVRKFKPGDRVELKKGGPIMEVLQYELEEKPFLGKIFSNEKVKCVWYENGVRNTQVFNQNVLTKSNVATGLFKT